MRKRAGLVKWATEKVLVVPGMDSKPTSAHFTWPVPRMNAAPLLLFSFF
jgi:hypothetical protein